MTGEVEIGHGGVVAVDPDALRDWRERMRGCAAEVGEAEQSLQAVPALVAQAGAAAVPAVWTTGRALDRVREALEALALAAGEMADVYELAELRAQQAMLGAGDVARARDLRRRVERLLAENPGLPALEERLQKRWRSGVAAGFAPEGDAALSPAALGDALLLGMSPALFLLDGLLGGNARVWTDGAKSLLASVAAENGVTPPTPLIPRPGLVLRAEARSPAGVVPGPGDVVLRPGSPGALPSGAGTPGAPPASLGEAVARVPSGSGAQVRVERYALADGSARFVAYVDGTRSNRADGAGSEPWDMASNGQAYLQHAESDAYKATVAALRDAGADATTPVDLVGYSQGGMIAGLIAQSGDFAVQGVFTVGSPIEPQLPESVLDVAVRHTDDPVAGLAGGGSPGGTGSPDSLVITRTVAPGHGVDPGIPAHLLGGYRETIRLAEASGDVRMDAVREHFAVLDGATMTATDYVATRVEAR